MHRSLTLTLALVAGTPPYAAAQVLLDPPVDHGPAEHTPIDIDRGLDWNAVLARAVQNYPQYIELEASMLEAEALARRSRSLFAGRPSLTLGYRSDDVLDDYGLAEYDTAVTLPLWRFGERRAAGRIGASASEQSAAAEDALVWEVAGALREAMWDIESALNGVELAGEALALAEDIDRVVARRYEIGDLPLEDRLLAESTVLERRTSLLEQRAALVDAEFAYELLTGLTVRPPALVETPTEERDFTASHPLLFLTVAAAERARAELELTARASRGAPTLLIGPRRQRDPLTTYYTDSVGVEVNIPFGGEAHAAASTAAARRRLAAAEAERAALERRLHAALHEALHTFETAESALAIARQRAEIAARHQDMGRTAFEQGEISLIDLLRRDEAARIAARDARAFEVQRGRAAAAVNQAVGVLP